MDEKANTIQIAKITNELFRAYLECKYKVYLRFQRTEGQVSDYEKYFSALAQKYSKDGVNMLIQKYPEKTILSTPASVSEIKIKKHGLITNFKVELYDCELHLEVLEIESKKEKRGYVFIPVLFLPQEKIHGNDKLLLAFQGYLLGKQFDVIPEYGKTIQSIGISELLRREMRIEKVLIVCPPSLKYQWKYEIEKFAHTPSITIIEGTWLKRQEQYKTAGFYSIVSTVPR